MRKAFVVVLVATSTLTIFAAGTVPQKPGNSNTSAPVKVNLELKGETDAITIPQLINYQGKLTDGAGNPVTTPQSMTFKFWDDPTVGNLKWQETQPVVTPDANGVFNVLLGSISPIDSVPAGGNLWLEVFVGVTPITPRTRIVSVPYAYSARKAADIDDDAVTMPKLNQSGAVSGDVIKWNGTDWVPAADVVGQDNDWVHSDSVLYTIRPLGIARGGAGNVLYGSGNCSNVNLGTACTTGTSAVSRDYTVIGGGYANVVTGDNSTVAGGQYNRACSSSATVGGGMQNAAQGGVSTIAGGWSNMALGDLTSVGGGAFNLAGSGFATVAGGSNDTALAFYGGVLGGLKNVAGDAVTDTGAAVGGGRYNRATAKYSTVAGGDSGAASGVYASVGGGRVSRATGLASTVAGGYFNQATNSYAAVLGGYYNSAPGDMTVVGGGDSNTAAGSAAVICGGRDNYNSGSRGFIGGGYHNEVRNSYATCSGGYANAANGYECAIGGGDNNIIGDSAGAPGPGSYATIPGGYLNQCRGAYSFAAGYRAKALQQGAFVWGDSRNVDKRDTLADAAMFFSSGGFYVYTNNAGNGKSSGVYVGQNGNAWVAVSDRNRKQNFRTLDNRDVLERVARMPVTRWNYKSEGSGIDHIGPMAQDFYAAFGLGNDEKGISTIDADGVALAAIQALYTQNQELLKRIETLEAQSGKDRR